MKVFVYRNLHKPGHVYSLRAIGGEYNRLVIGYTSELQLANVQFRVNENGRQRVLRERRKNVHAGLVGDLVWVGDDFCARQPTKKPGNSLAFLSQHVVRYNPYHYSTFVTADDRPIQRAAFVQVSGALIVACEDRR